MESGLFVNLFLRTGSTPTVGSSRMNRSGSWKSATAKETRRCCPPLRVLTERCGGGRSSSLKRKSHLRRDESRWQLIDTTKVLERLLDAELSVESQLLRHVADASTGDSTLDGARLSAEHHHFSTVKTATSHDTAEQRRFTAATGT